MDRLQNVLRCAARAVDVYSIDRPRRQSNALKREIDEIDRH